MITFLKERNSIKKSVFLTLNLLKLLGQLQFYEGGKYSSFIILCPVMFVPSKLY